MADEPKPEAETAEGPRVFETSKTQKMARLGISWIQGNPLPESSTNPIIHMYRGEVQRETVWRQRLDTTTNWAILTASAVISVAYGNEKSPHVLLFLGSIMVLLLLFIEGRRYRYYDVWRARTRMLEAHFFVPLLIYEMRLPQGDWRKRLAEDLLQPAFKMGWLEAVAVRLKRNYIWIFLVLFLAWVGKITYGQGRSITTWGQFYRALGEGPVPAWLTLFVGLLFHLVVLGMLVYGYPRREREAAIRKQITRQTDWPV